jgi:signal transduction histidine kinase
MSDTDIREDADAARRLVFAMCHEISNLIGAVRLRAHLLNEDQGPRELGVASLEIDDLSARSSALLALFRPILSPPDEAEEIAAETVVLGIERELEEHGGRGVELTVEAGHDLPALRANPEIYHYLLVSQLLGAIDAAGAGGSVRLVVEAREGEVVFAVEDSGEADDQMLEWWKSSLRGRVLGCALADHILSRRGGRFAVLREKESTRAEICAPRA